MEKIENSFYVDGFSGGDTSFEMALELYKKLRVRLGEVYFNLRKWRTNVANLRKLISETAQNDRKDLGILLDEIDNTFIFDFKEIVELSQILSASKRNILKILAMFFDPIGIFQPLVINFKILFQKVCKGNLTGMKLFLRKYKKNGK